MIDGAEEWMPMMGNFEEQIMQWVVSGLTTGYSMTAVADGLVGARAVAVAEEDLARLALCQGVKSKRVTAVERGLRSRMRGSWRSRWSGRRTCGTR